MKQAAKHIMMVRPKHFGYDPVTADSNSFQQEEGAEQVEEITMQAIVEFDNAVAQLKSKGINVTVFEDSDQPVKPNAIFPNNWVSFHGDQVVLYPMLAENRRKERRLEFIEQLKSDENTFESLIDLSPNENEELFLESTGSVIFDYENRKAYACLSPRTNEKLFRELCDILDYEAIAFFARDAEGELVYHTNVMMCLAAKYSVICLASIDANQRAMVTDAIESSGHAIVDISMEQAYQFAGNMFELSNNKGDSFLVMSQAAYDSLRTEQIEQIEEFSEIIAIPIPTIEKFGGGSIRCMICRVS